MIREIFAVILSLLLLGSLAGVAVAQDVSGNEEAEDLTELPPGLALGMVMSKLMLDVKGDSQAIMLKYRLMYRANESEAADIMLNKTEELEDLIQEMLEEKEELIEKFQNGEINETEFAIRMIQINMEFRNAVKELMALQECYGKFDERVKLKLMERGINATAIEMLKVKARTMSGEDVREIAKMIKVKKKIREQEREFEEEEMKVGGNVSSSEINETLKEAKEAIEEFRKGNISEEEFKDKMKEIREELREKAKSTASGKAGNRGGGL